MQRQDELISNLLKSSGTWKTTFRIWPFSNRRPLANSVATPDIKANAKGESPLTKMKFFFVKMEALSEGGLVTASCHVRASERRRKLEKRRRTCHAVALSEGGSRNPD
jgi:hypothetical protein